jgi:hypothetical protein
VAQGGVLRDDLAVVVGLLFAQDLNWFIVPDLPQEARVGIGP